MQVGSFKRRKPPCSVEPGVCSWFCSQRHAVLIGHAAGALSWAPGPAAKGGPSPKDGASPQGQAPPLRALGPELLDEGFYRVHHHLHRNSCQQQTGNTG